MTTEIVIRFLKEVSSQSAKMTLLKYVGYGITSIKKNISKLLSCSTKNLEYCFSKDAQTPQREEDVEGPRKDPGLYRSVGEEGVGRWEDAEVIPSVVL